MATWIPNQPVFFGELTDNCSCDSDTGAQLVDNTDSTQVQFNLSPCPDAENFIEDSDFGDLAEWTLGSNWTISYNQLCLEGGNIVNTYAYGQDVFETGKYYQVNITVNSISDGSISVYLGGTNIGTIETSGEYTFYGFSTVNAITGGQELIFLNNDIDVSCCISEATAYEIYTQFKYAIYNNSGVYITEISYTNDPDYFTFYEDSLTVTFNWGELGVSNGCYYICLLDPCTNSNGQNIPITITNSGFTGSATGWTLGTNWSYGSNAVSWSVGAGNLSQTIFPTYSLFAKVTVDVTDMADTGGLGIGVYFGTVLIDTIFGAGVYEFEGTPYGGFDLVLIPSPLTSGTITSITWVAPTTNQYICDLQSNSFKLADYTDNCTLIVNACNNEDGLGFVFSGSGFTPRLRLKAKLKKAQYPNERTVYEDSLGSKKSVYFKRRKAKEFCTDLEPEYIHDFLSLALGFDNFYINNSAYFVEDDEYNVDYPESSDNLGSVKFLVSEKVQNITNNNCTDVENVCNLPPNYLLQADDASQFITLTNGELILING